MTRILSFFLLLGTFLFSAQAHAVLNIDITRGNVDPMPIALPYLGSDTAAGQAYGKQIMEVVEQDLARSGLFRPIERRAFLQEIKSGSTVPVFLSWRQINAAALVAGSVQLSSANRLSVEFRLWDVFSEKQIAGKSYETNPNNWRRIAHLIADLIYSRITGESGYFDTRIVYVSESGPGTKRIKRLAIMDQDGENHRYLTDGRDLVLTPRFSPTAQEVVYMSYSGGVPKVYVLNVDTLQKTLVGTFPGMSFAPRFSPDGKFVVMSVSLNGNSEIFLMNLRTKEKIRLTNDSGIDTSPSFSPDGKQIVFNSDRGGSQQLYVMNRDGSGVKRISFAAGRYGTPVWSPRGDLVAFTKMLHGKFYIGVMRIDGSGERLLTESFLDEGPTWSPNGRVISFARQEPSYRGRVGRWEIRTIDLTGYNGRTMRTPKEASDPAWSPLL